MLQLWEIKLSNHLEEHLRFISGEYKLLNDKQEEYRLSKMPDYYIELSNYEDSGELFKTPGTVFTWRFFPKTANRLYDEDFKNYFFVLVTKTNTVSRDEFLKEVLSTRGVEVLNIKKVHETRLHTNRKPSTVSNKGDKALSS